LNATSANCLKNPASGGFRVRFQEKNGVTEQQIILGFWRERKRERERERERVGGNLNGVV
jgi:hypothetical protein